MQSQKIVRTMAIVKHYHDEVLMNVILAGHGKTKNHQTFIKLSCQ